VWDIPSIPHLLWKDSKKFGNGSNECEEDAGTECEDASLQKINLEEVTLTG
jgi:hypothetical protein